MDTTSAQWLEEVLFEDGDLYFTDLLDGIRGAKRSIYFETYIFEPGLLGERITQALCEAAQRGCDVRVLVDGIGSPSFSHSYENLLRNNHVRVRLFRAWPWRLPWSSFFKQLLRINRGTHRKFCLIDQEVAWIGSFNVSDIHLRERYQELAWMDLGVRVRGPDLIHLAKSFLNTFNKNIIYTPSLKKSPLVLMNSAALIRRRLEHRYVGLFKNADSFIWLQTPYFVPVRPVYRQLIKASERGLDVRLIVPASHDIPFVKAMSYAFFYRLLKKGVLIFEFENRFPHQKIIQVDGLALIGSSNLNHRSFLHDLELDVLITHDSNKSFLKKKFLREQELSRELSLEDLHRQSYLQVFWSWLVLWLRYWF